MDPYALARQKIDAAHAADPRKTADGRPQELVYADRVEAWVLALVLVFQNSDNLSDAWPWSPTPRRPSSSPPARSIWSASLFPATPSPWTRPGITPGENPCT